jgi:hypothetical protein
MTVPKSDERERQPVPLDDIDILVGREPLTPEDAARQSAEEIMESIQVDLDQIFQSLVLSASIRR